MTFKELNEDRARRGRMAIYSGCEPNEDDNADLMDVLANIMHASRTWAHGALDFDAALDVARTHFQAEITQEELVYANQR